MLKCDKCNKLYKTKGRVKTITHCPTCGEKLKEYGEWGDRPAIWGKK